MKQGFLLVQKKQSTSLQIGREDSLDAPQLMVLKADRTFEVYEPEFNWNSDYTQYTSYTWQKSGNSPFTTGEGTFILIGKQLQLTDNYGGDYGYLINIDKLTTTELQGHGNSSGYNETFVYRKQNN